MSDLILPKGARVVHDSQYGVCVWQVPSGGYIRDSEFNYLSLEGKINDPRVEEKMRQAAKVYTGSTDGRPKWFPGRRKISDMEYEDQIERLIDGKTPDRLEGLW